MNHYVQTAIISPHDVVIDQPLDVDRISSLADHSNLRIGIRGGQTFNKQLTLSGNNTTVNPIGSFLGAPTNLGKYTRNQLLNAQLPIFSGANTITGVWTQPDAGGNPNVWSTPITFDQGADSSHLGNAYANGTVLLQRFGGTLTANLITTNAQLTTAGVGYCYVTNWALASTTLQVYSVGNPGSSGITYTYTARSFGVVMVSSENPTTSAGFNFKCRGVITQYSCHQGGSLVTHGNNSSIRDCLIQYGSRHNTLCGVGATYRNCYVYAASDSGEAGPNANLMVVNQPTFTSADGYSCILCSFDGGVANSDNTGPDNHDGVSTDRLGPVTLTNCLFYRLAVCYTASATNQLLSYCNFVGCAQGASPNGSIGLTIDSCTSYDLDGSGNQLGTFAAAGLNQMFFDNGSANALNNMTITSKNNKIANIVIGTLGFFDTEYGGGSSNVITSTNDSFHVASASGNFDLFRIAAGTLTITNFLMGPSLSATIRAVRAGFTDAASNHGVVTYSGSNNTWSYGQTFTFGNSSGVNTSYSLPQVQTTLTNEIGSVSTGNYNGPVGQGSVIWTDTGVFTAGNGNPDLGSRTTPVAWSRVGGVSGAALIAASNGFSFGSTTQTLYTAPSAPTKNYALEVTVTAVPASGGPWCFAMAVVDANNAIVCRWATAGYSVGTWIAGAFVQFLNGGTPTVGDVVRVYAEYNVGTGQTTYYLYVNQRLVQSGTPINHTLDGGQAVGLITRASTQANMYGTLTLIQG